MRANTTWQASLAHRKPTANGRLRDTPLSHLLLYTQNRTLSGTLLMHTPVQCITLHIDESMVLSVLEPPEISSTPEGFVLPWFGEEEAVFSFYAGVDPPSSVPRISLGVSLLHLVSDGIRAFAREEVIHSVVDKLQKHAVQLKEGTPVAAMGFGTEEEQIVQTLRSPVRVRNLYHAGNDPQTVDKVLYLLTITKFIEPLRPSRKAAPRPSGAAPKSSRSPNSSGSPNAVSSRVPRSTSSSPPQNQNVTPPEGTLGTETHARESHQGLSEAHRERWERLVARAESIEAEDYFSRLDLKPQADTAAVRKAFHAAAKTWHPDRLPKALAELRPKASLVFRAIQEAYTTLSNERTAEEYRAQFQTGEVETEEDVVKATSLLDAALEFQKIEIFVRRNDWATALERVDELIAKAPDEADFHALRARALFEINGTKTEEHAQESLASANKALEIAPEHIKALLCKGHILLAADACEEAMDAFYAVLRNEPNNLDARRAIRLQEKRTERNSQPPEEKASFWKRLLGG